MAKIDPVELVKGISAVYTLPDIYYHLDEAINNPTSSNSQITEIISEDTGLAGRVLRLSNSAFYGVPSKIDTISGALAIIGTQQVRDLVLAISVIEAFRGVPENIVSMESFWRHSIACGVAAKIVATQCRVGNLESFFLAGLLHDIGSLIIYSKLEDVASKIISSAKEKGISLHVAEKAALGFDHARLGGLLLEEWKLPKHLIHAVHTHHKPQKTVDQRLEADAVHLADIIVHAMQMGNSGESLVPPMDQGAWNRIGLSESSLNNIMSLLEAQYDDIASIISNG